MTRTAKWCLLALALALLVALLVTLPRTVAVRRWVFDLLPLIVLMACPLLHLGSHGHHAHRVLPRTEDPDATAR
jgi:hypothetical protein